MDKITIIIPIHNKENYIFNTIESIINQDYSVYKLILLLDNCTDNTEYIIKNSGLLESLADYEIVYSKGNTHKKSGALNQLFSKYINVMENYIMILDADTIIENDAILNGMNMLKSDMRLGAVCSKAGVVDYSGNNIWQKILWGLQHIEYAQFDSHRVETRGKIKVVHGMCALFKKEALLGVAQMRNTNMEKSFSIYLEDNLVEDYEMTICLKLLGWKVSSCIEMKAYTEVPLYLKELFIQRLRWLRGGVDTLRLHSINKVTFIDNLNNLFFVVINIMKLIVFVYILIDLFRYGFYLPNIPVVIVFLVMYIDSLYRMKYICKISYIDIIIKILIIPEILYSLFQTSIMALSIFYSYFGINQEW